jgi:cytochrome c biogenesis protein CcmG/thiol:disulfide interchange protein DsbE
MDDVSRILLACGLSPVFALAGCGGGSSQGTSTQIAAVGKPAPSWNEPLASGGTMSSSSLAGKPVYLNFFATWCPPCNAEAPDVNAIQQQFASQGLHVIGVDVLENAARARQFVAEHHLGYPAVVDDGTLRDAYRINGMPVHVFINAKGIVKKIVVGELSKSQMEADVRTIL